MDDGKILIVNLSRGLVGEDNAAILGSMLVTKIQLAAMSRADIPRLENRRPFYLYVDEFQNFATESFAVILSEARKYALNLTIANQYISQLEEHVRGAVFGNVGTMVTFRVSPDDSPFLAKYFEPQFEAADLSNFHNRHFVASMTINGEKAVAFSGTTLNIPETERNNTTAIVDHSRSNYSTAKKDVETAIRQATSSTPIHTSTPVPNSPKTTGSSRIPNIPLPIEHPAGAAYLSESQKRRLRRKRNKQNSETTTAEQANVIIPNKPSDPDDESVLRLR
jgi:hypothetical protein